MMCYRKTMEKTAKTIHIHWQRLLDGGETCQRCGATETAVEEACRRLQEALGPWGVRVVLEKTTLDPAAFARDPQQSNLITLNGRPLEEWLQASTGQSPCCGPCGDNECRTLELNGQVYEAIPAELIVQAGLLAARPFLPRLAGECCPRN